MLKLAIVLFQLVVATAAFADTVSLDPGSSLTVGTTTVVCSASGQSSYVRTYCKCTEANAMTHAYLGLYSLPDAVLIDQLAEYRTTAECLQGLGENPACR